MKLSATDIVHNWHSLCMDQDGYTKKLIHSLVAYMVNNQRYIITTDDRYTITGSIQVLITENEQAKLFTKHQFLHVEMVFPGKYISRTLANNDRIGIDLYFVVTDHPFEYARHNEYNLIKFSNNGIFNYTAITQRCIHNEALAMELLHPRRIQKWIDNGNELEDYLI